MFCDRFFLERKGVCLKTWKTCNDLTKLMMMMIVIVQTLGCCGQVAL